MPLRGLRYRPNNDMRGFTLIELMVVIAIISILIGITFVGTAPSVQAGYDARRKADLVSIKTALELYYNQNGSYPTTNGSWSSQDGTGGTTNNGTNWIPGLASTYIQKLPQDPLYPTPSNNAVCIGGGWHSEYLYDSNGANYKLLAHCPASSNVPATKATDDYYDPVRTTWAWMVCSGEPACSNW